MRTMFVTSPRENFALSKDVPKVTFLLHLVEAVRNAGHGGRNLHRRDIFVWVCIILFLNQLSDIILATPSVSLEKVLYNIGSIGIFQLMAWYAVFRFLISSNPAAAVQRRDFLVAAALGFIIFLPTARIIWIAASMIAAYWLIFNAGDFKLRAAGAVLAALSVQAFWGHVIFHLIAFPLLCAETAVVGTILEVARAGTVWQDNVITGPNGYGIVIFDQCSVFHNLSLAILCWVTVSKLQREKSYFYDFIFGVLVVITMILWNIARLCLMAWNIDLFHFWHDGTGADIFAIGASLSALLISLYGSRPVRLPT
jgi:hypothetical protein